MLLGSPGRQVATLGPNVALADAAHKLTVDCAPLTDGLRWALAQPRFALCYKWSSEPRDVAGGGRGGERMWPGSAGTSQLYRHWLRLTCGH